MRKQFDIKYRPQIESGEYKVETKGGNPILVLAWDLPYDFPIATAEFTEDNRVIVESYSVDGWVGYGEKENNLVIVTPEPELSDWQTFISGCLQKHGLLDCGAADRIAKECSAELLDLAREQFIKDGYIIEKKAFHDAVENISDKHRAEMSVEYSIHCKVENGARRAILNWDTFQKVAQKFIDIGKAEVLKDLPRWKKADKHCSVGPSLMYDKLGFYESSTTKPGCLFISIENLKKLPGFKED